MPPVTVSRVINNASDEPNKTNVPDPEVVPRAKRRRFNTEYKLRILEEGNACTEIDTIPLLNPNRNKRSVILTPYSGCVIIRSKILNLKLDMVLS